jgi:hypothetical protein
LKPDNKRSIELDRLMTDREKRILFNFLDSFAKNLNNSARLKGRKLRVVMETETGSAAQIPCSIFSKRLGVLETLVKYLHEEENLSLGQISGILKRSPNNIAVSYRNSKLKKPEAYRKTSSPVKIPLDIFNESNTCFESVCLYLKDTLELSFHDIGKLLGRNERTIWTIYTRGVRRLKNG